MIPAQIADRFSEYRNKKLPVLRISTKGIILFT